MILLVSINQDGKVEDKKASILFYVWLYFHFIYPKHAYQLFQNTKNNQLIVWNNKYSPVAHVSW